MYYILILLNTMYVIVDTYCVIAILYLTNI